VAAAATSLLAAIGCSEPPTHPVPDPTSPPSVILIVIDTLRVDFLGCFGFDGPISPNLDALGQRSVVFERCSSQAPWTTPSVASMMTSLYPEAHGVRLGPDDPRTLSEWRQRWTRAIPDETVTLAELLRARGYRTAAFVANTWMTGDLGFDQGFEVFDTSAADRRDRDASALLASGLHWLRTVEAAGRPTLLYLHLMDVHGPYDAPDTDYFEIWESPGLGPPQRLPEAALDGMERYLLRPRWARLDDRLELRSWRARYGAGVHAVDRRLGSFFRALESEGMWDHQVVIVTSDHGEELHEHGGWDHGFNLYEHQVHVPLMIRFPRDHHAGARVARPVRLVDLLPTVVRLAGAGSPDGAVGADLMPRLGDSAGTPRRTIAFSTAVKDRPDAGAVFDGRYKLISDPGSAPPQLFDLIEDPGETTDIAATASDIAAELAADLTAERARITAGDPGTGSAGEIPPEQLERLRELGYLD
jgi:arylsulfatase A-like enzyme